MARIFKSAWFFRQFMAWDGGIFCFHDYYSNGYLNYGAPASYYDKGGYEVTECLLAPEWQGIYEQKANEIISRLQ